MRRVLLGSVTAAVTIAYVIAGVVALTSGPFGPEAWLWLLLGPPSFLVAGLVLFVRRPGHPVGELLVLLAITALLVPQILEVPVVLRFQETGPEGWMWLPMWAAKTLSAVGAVLGATLVALLPDGRFRHRRERRFLGAAWATVVLPTLSLVSNERFVRQEEMSFPGVSDIPSPLVIEALQPYGPLLAGLGSLPYLAFLGGIVLLVLRMRHAPARERKQVRWVLFAGILAVAVGVGPLVLSAVGLMQPLTHGVAGFVAFLPLLLLPASIVVAVLEPRWLDVDVIIRKSFVYGALSALILILYVGLASAFGLAAGARLPVEVAVVVTVAVAVLFQPARRRLQTLADRWVFGNRPTDFEVVTDFAAALGTSPDPTDLLPGLTETVADTLGLQWARVEVNGFPSHVSGKARDDPALVAPIVYQGEMLGRIVCGPKREGTLTQSEARLVATLAAQAALALYNARLAGRVVTAQEAERRRIERNIHDGAQQELVALVARLGLARARARGGTLTEKVLADLQEEARRILTDLRELAQGIRPSVLSDGGLLAAIEDRCGRLPIEVTLEAPRELRGRRFPDEIEGGAYFFITEGIANVLKHARATRATVALRDEDGRLRIEVGDDGVGFEPDEATGNGLGGLRDRITALGGSMRVESRPGEGTHLSAVLPVEGGYS